MSRNGLPERPVRDGRTTHFDAIVERWPPVVRETWRWALCSPSTQGGNMLNTTRSRVRALAVAGMAVVAGGVAAVTYSASAAEVAAPAAIGADARAVAVPAIPAAIKPPAGSRPIGA